MDIMYYIGLDVHKKTISCCVKDARGQVHQEYDKGRIAASFHGTLETHNCYWKTLQNLGTCSPGMLLVKNRHFTNTGLMVRGCKAMRASVALAFGNPIALPSLLQCRKQPRRVYDGAVF